MKAVFCDCDGVLNDTHTTVRIGQWDFVDDEKVARLAEIVKATGAVVVLSSDWRFLPTCLFEGTDRYDAKPMWPALLAKLKEYGMELYGTTGEYNWSRGHEIMAYVNEHPEIDRWVAIDDIANLGPAEAHHVWTNPNQGLTDAEVRECIARLNDDADAPDRAFSVDYEVN